MNTTIQLYELLEAYRAETMKEWIDYSDCETKEELKYQITIHALIEAIELIKKVLVYDL